MEMVIISEGLKIAGFGSTRSVLSLAGLSIHQCLVFEVASRSIVVSVSTLSLISASLSSVRSLVVEAVVVHRRGPILKLGRFHCVA